MTKTKLREPTQAECERMVRQEVLCCVSGLVSTLATGAYAVSSPAKARGMVDAGNMLATLCEKALELAAPIDDWEETATQANWKHGGDGKGFWYDAHAYESWKAALSDQEAVTYDDARELCDGESLDVYQREVFEHWAVSQWLAGKLIEQGEKVDTDFEGLNVWARTCTGQAIHLDGVIVRIVAATRYGMGS